MRREVGDIAFADLIHFAKGILIVHGGKELLRLLVGDPTGRLVRQRLDRRGEQRLAPSASLASAGARRNAAASAPEPRPPRPPDFPVAPPHSICRVIFDKMQGGRPISLLESHCAVESWKNVSLSKEQGEASGIAGKSREADGAGQGS
jgi:hypothetical protein